jgi:hypothetical protein
MFKSSKREDAMTGYTYADLKSEFRMTPEFRIIIGKAGDWQIHRLSANKRTARMIFSGTAKQAIALFAEITTGAGSSLPAFAGTK